MAATITVEKMRDPEFVVRVIELGSESKYHVTVKQDDYNALTNGRIDVEELIRRSFLFLLEREPKESILARFDLSVISRYFPEYKNEIARSLPQ